MTTDSRTFHLGPHSVRRIGYGAMQLAGPGVFGPPADRGAALSVLREAVARGVDHIDTSDVYGPHVTNQLIREALHPYPDGLVVATKVGMVRGPTGSWDPAFSAAELERQVHENLTNLGKDVLDLVYFRASFGATGPAEGSIEAPLTALAELRRRGLLRSIGLSNVTRAQIDEGRSVTEIVAVQNHYNLVHRDDDTLVDALASDGIAYVPYFPLGGFTPIQSRVLDEVAERVGATPTQVALAWLWSKSYMASPIIGATKVEQLDDAAKAVETVLTAEEVAALEKPYEYRVTPAD